MLCFSAGLGVGFSSRAVKRYETDKNMSTNYISFQCPCFLAVTKMYHKVALEYNMAQFTRSALSDTPLSDVHT